MASLSLAQAASAVRNAIIPPRFRCSECRQVKPKTVFDLPEADGSYVCLDCERAYRDPEPAWWETDDRYADVPAALLEAAR
jgi:hypothetical protein